MPKPKASVEVVKIGITTSRRVALFLDKLVATEIYGRSRSEVAEQLIKRTMEKFLLDPQKLENLNKKL